MCLNCPWSLGPRDPQGPHEIFGDLRGPPRGSQALLRFICFHSTILPAPMKLENRFIFGIIPNYTYDLIFSGHTMTCVLSIFCTQKIFIPYCFLLSLLCSISVIVTKEHYTIDTIIAWIATYSVVSFYSIDFEQLLD